jgi:hypothetical protein
MSRNKQRLLTITDVTLARTSRCVARAVAAKGTMCRRDLRRLDFLADFSKFRASGRGRRGGT